MRVIVETDLKEEIIECVKEKKEVPLDLDGDFMIYKGSLYYVNVLKNDVYVIISD